jgi:glycosyltransferase involved in cell wall biosynthesis
MVSARATTRVAGLAAAMTRRGHQVSVYTRRANSDEAEKFQARQGYTVFRVPAGPAEQLPGHELPTAMGQLAEYLHHAWKLDRPDVTHAYCWTSGIASQLVSRRLGLPAVLTIEGLDGVPQLAPQLKATAVKSADWVTVASTDDAFSLVRTGRPRHRISVVPYGVDVDLFTPVGASAPKRAKYRIVSAGDSLLHNTFDDIVRAMPMIPHAELAIIGGPQPSDAANDPEAVQVRSLATNLGVGRRVHLHGSVDRTELPQMLRSADVVVCNQLSGADAIEAMACGVPVVAAVGGAVRDAVVHDVTGYLLPPKDPRGLANAINTLLRDSFLRKSFGAAARDRACACYGWDRIAEDVSRIYEHTMGAQRAPATTT